MYSLPNILTLSRIVVIPVIFLSIYIHSTVWSVLAGVLFVMASITDYLDGYLARARNQNSVFGRLLDPIADKLLVISALVIIVANQMVHPISYVPVIIIMCREVLVSGLREFLSEFNVGMPVTPLAKWKTGFQMTAISWILLRKLLVIGEIVGNVGEFLLWIAGVLTFITGYQYLQKCMDYIHSVENNKKKTTPEKATKKAEIKVAESVVEEKKAKSEKAVKKATVKKTPAKKAALPKKSAVKKKTVPVKKTAKS